MGLVIVLAAGGLLAAGGFLYPRLEAAVSGPEYDLAVRVPPDDHSMGTTHAPGDQLLLVADADLRRGDMVVVDTAAWGLPGQMVRRVVGLPGDTVVCCDESERLVVNGRALEEDYLGPARGSFPYTANVPAGSVVVLGDNRADSVDSRGFAERSGALPLTAVQGRAVRIQPAQGAERDFPATGAFVAAGLAEPRPPAAGPQPLTWAVLSGAGAAGVAVLGLLVLAVAGLVRRFRASGAHDPGGS